MKQFVSKEPDVNKGDFTSLHFA